MAGRALFAVALGVTTHTIYRFHQPSGSIGAWGSTDFRRGNDCGEGAPTNVFSLLGLLRRSGGEHGGGGGGKTYDGIPAELVAFCDAAFAPDDNKSTPPSAASLASPIVNNPQEVSPEAEAAPAKGADGDDDAGDDGLIAVTATLKPWDDDWDAPSAPGPHNADYAAAARRYRALWLPGGGGGGAEPAGKGERPTSLSAGGHADGAAVSVPSQVAGTQPQSEPQPQPRRRARGRQILLVRHGQYQYEANEAVGEEERRLTRLGEAQAAATGEYLRQAAVLSPLTRAQAIVVAETERFLRHAKHERKKAEQAVAAAADAAASEGSEKEEKLSTKAGAAARKSNRNSSEYDAMVVGGSANSRLAAAQELEAAARKSRDRAVAKLHSMGESMMTSMFRLADTTGETTATDAQGKLTRLVIAPEEAVEIVSSDLTRAKQTADIIFEKMYNPSSATVVRTGLVTREVPMDNISDDDPAFIHSNNNASAGGGDDAAGYKPSDTSVMGATNESRPSSDNSAAALRARVRVIDEELRERFPCDPSPKHRKSAQPSDRAAVERVFRRYFFRPQYSARYHVLGGGGVEGEPTQPLPDTSAAVSAVATAAPEITFNSRKEIRCKEPAVGTPAVPPDTTNGHHRSGGGNDTAEPFDETIIIVGHANVIRYVVMRALQLPPEAWLRVALAHGSITNVRIDEKGHARVRGVGLATHMPESMVTYRNLKFAEEK